MRTPSPDRVRKEARGHCGRESASPNRRRQTFGSRHEWCGFRQCMKAHEAIDGIKVALLLQDIGQKVATQRREALNTTETRNLEALLQSKPATPNSTSKGNAITLICDARFILIRAIQGWPLCRLTWYFPPISLRGENLPLGLAYGPRSGMSFGGSHASTLYVVS
jgi:hypothetical protein